MFTIVTDFRANNRLYKKNNKSNNKHIHIEKKWYVKSKASGFLIVKHLNIMGEKKQTNKQQLNTKVQIQQTWQPCYRL